MKLISQLLNKLSLVSYKDSSGPTATLVALVLTVVVLVLCCFMVLRIDKKLVFTIDAVELGDTHTVTVGENSGVSMQGVPHDYLKISYADGTFTWEVNEQYHDSLQYFKINNDNPNKHTIRDDASQLIQLRLPLGEGQTKQLTFTGAEIWQDWRQFKRQKDVQLRHFAVRHQLQTDSVSHADSLLLMAQLQKHDVRSFLENNDGSIVLVILDELTQLTDGDSTYHYARRGTASHDGAHSGHCKVQFFGVADNCYMDSGGESGYFEIGGVNYVMKPTVKLTSWGAGHVMLSHDKGNLTLRFPRPVTYVGSVDSLRKKSESSSGIITLKQDNRSYPTKSDLYLPAFSGAINFDLCNIELFHDGDSIVLSDNNRHTTLVRNGKTAFLPTALVPTLQRTTLQSGSDRLHCRSGYINGGYVFSYLWLSLLTYFVLLLLIWIPGSPLRVSGRQVRTLYNQKQVSHYPAYLSMLLTAGMCYCVCKTLITLKLSYTYPYFEKLTGITPVASALMLLLFFSLAMLINSPLLHIHSKPTRSTGRWILWAVCTLLCGGLAGAFFCLLDPAVSQHTLLSYFEGEVYSPWPWKWLDAYGINDTHRSVVYALLFTEVGVLLVWAVLNVGWHPISKHFDQLFAKWGRWSEKVSGKVGRFWHRHAQLPTPKELAVKPSDNKVLRYLKGCPRRVPLALLLLVGAFLALAIIGWSKVVMVMALALALVVVLFDFVHDALTGALKILFPGHMLLLVVLALIGNRFGNFGTAFITLLVILGMTHALSQVKIEKDGKSRHTLFSEMFFITGAYICGAMVGDNGYMTNYLGFVMCLVSFYFLLERPRAFSGDVKREASRERKWVNRLLIFVAAMVLTLPLLCSMIFSPDKVDYNRLTRRVLLYSNFEDLERNGYRYNESDAEFMVIMSHYMQERSTDDPLSNDIHFLHPSISTGQSPVVLNDLSAPAAFFGAYGTVPTTLVFFLLLFLLIWLVMQYSLSYVDSLRPQLTKAMQWRLLAMFMWVGTSFYIYLSYIDGLPYTGRLNPGLGVDAVGEALESAILLAFMAAMTCRKKQSFSL